ncbi:MAG: hypothetical protein ACM3WV_05210 [Bacillota bacterium]
MALYDLPGKTVLMHNRMGIRIELNFDRAGLMELWISPQAGKSLYYRDRNFSCRDDHTRIFDRIGFPGLKADHFVKCEYDPFYSIMKFKKQEMHVMTLFDKPVVVCWFEKAQKVDLKSDKQDALAERNRNSFILKHPDRGKNFTFAALMEEGAGAFRHQLQVDEGRSTYARAELAPRQRLAFAGEISAEPVAGFCRAVFQTDIKKMLADNERRIEEAVRPGTLYLRGRGNLQRLLNVNKRILLAMQDASGAIRAALNRIYYLIWVRDGAIIECYNGYSGWPEPLRKWTEFLLANPTEIKGEEPEGRTFLMLVNKITKWEEDGVFYAIWTAFTAWTQTGDGAFVSGSYLALLREAMDWLEKRCYNKETGLFRRYFYCESPFPGSRDDGFDNAVGLPIEYGSKRLRGKKVKSAEDFYINSYAYACYIMLAAMTSGGIAEAYLKKAGELAKLLKAFFTPETGELPPYGKIYAHDGSMFKAEGYGLDMTDQVWGCSVALFYPEPWQLPGIRRRIMKDVLRRPDKFFLAGYFAACAAADLEWIEEKALLKAFDYAAKRCYKPGKYLAMPYTIKEFANMPDGNPYHDVRPQAFSISPWLAAVAGLGLRRLPFGLAVRPNTVLKEIRDYEYRGTSITWKYMGKGRFCRVILNGELLHHTLQIPEARLKPDSNDVQIQATGDKPAGPVLIGSTIRLEDVKADGGQIVYSGQAYGLNCMEFKDIGDAALEITAEGGCILETDCRTAEGIIYVNFKHQGGFTAVVKAR